jgi:preprotein translocase subunit SecE
MYNSVQKTNLLSRLIQYLKESREELRKVSWPNRKDTTRYSIIVIVLCVVMAIFFGAFDYSLNKGLSWLVSLIS